MPLQQIDLSREHVSMGQWWTGRPAKRAIDALT
ncbi:hypothetical protein OKW37_000567 [Paraburkholderia sp. MM5482-R2]